MLDLRIPSGFFFAALGMVLAIYAMVAPEQRAPLTIGNVNLYCGVFILCFGACLLLLARRRRS